MFAWSVFIPFVLIGALTPGPNNLLALHTGSRCGYRRSLPFIAGVTFGVFWLLLLCALLSIFVQTLIPKIQFWTRLFGSGYLLYLALRISFSRTPDRPGGEGDVPAASFTAGVLLQLVNPKAMAYATLIFSTMIAPVYTAWWEILLFCTGLSGLTFAAVSLWAAGGALLSGLLRQHERWINPLLGLVLLYTAGSILFGLQ